MLKKPRSRTFVVKNIQQKIEDKKKQSPPKSIQLSDITIREDDELNKGGIEKDTSIIEKDLSPILKKPEFDGFMG